MPSRRRPRSVKVWERTLWLLAGAPNLSGGEADDVKLLYPSGFWGPVVCYQVPAQCQAQDQRAGSPTQLMRDSGTAETVARCMHQTCASSGRCTPAFHPPPRRGPQDVAAGRKLSCKRFVNGGWSFWGPAGFTPGQANYLSMAYDPKGDTILVAFQVIGRGGHRRGSAWLGAAKRGVCATGGAHPRHAAAARRPLHTRRPCMRPSPPQDQKDSQARGVVMRYNKNTQKWGVQAPAAGPKWFSSGQVTGAGLPPLLASRPRPLSQQGRLQGRWQRPGRCLREPALHVLGCLLLCKCLPQRYAACACLPAQADDLSLAIHPGTGLPWVAYRVRCLAFWGLAGWLAHLACPLAAC